MVANPELLDQVRVSEVMTRRASRVAEFTSVGDTLELDTDEFNGAVFSWRGTFTGGGIAFEGSYDDKTSWVALSAVSVAGGSPVTTVSALSAPGAYDVYAPCATHMRLRCTALTSGAISVKGAPVVFAADSAPSLGSDPRLASISSSANVIIGDVSNSPRATSGGLALIARLLSSAASTNAASIKSSAGRLYKIRGYNANAAVRYLKLYNKSIAPTVGTDVPAITIALAPAREFDLDLIPIGEYFSSGIAYALTTGVADADTGALTAGDILGLTFWYI